MKTVAMIVVLTVSFVGSFSAPAEKSTKTPPARFVKNDYVYDSNGQFSLNYQLDDGTSQTRQGTLVLNDEGDDYVMIQKGSYSYMSPEGVPVRVSYVADKDGFKMVDYSVPSSDVVARPPPPAELKSKSLPS